MASSSPCPASNTLGVRARNLGSAPGGRAACRSAPSCEPPGGRYPVPLAFRMASMPSSTAISGVVWVRSARGDTGGRHKSLHRHLVSRGSLACAGSDGVYSAAWSGVSRQAACQAVLRQSCMGRMVDLSYPCVNWFSWTPVVRHNRLAASPPEQYPDRRRVVRCRAMTVRLRCFGHSASCHSQCEPCPLRMSVHAAGHRPPPPAPAAGKKRHLHTRRSWHKSCFSWPRALRCLSPCHAMWAMGVGGNREGDTR